jgi:hypothetical protein
MASEVRCTGIRRGFLYRGKTVGTQQDLAGARRSWQLGAPTRRGPNEAAAENETRAGGGKNERRTDLAGKRTQKRAWTCREERRPAGPLCYSEPKTRNDDRA